MGQAKARGTFEQRKAAAEQRNRMIESVARKMSPKAKVALRQHGTQRFATRMIAKGAMPQLTVATLAKSP